MVRSVLAEAEHVENEVERLLKQSAATQVSVHYSSTLTQKLWI